MLWKPLLRLAISNLVGTYWPVIITLVKDLVAVDVSGEEKRRSALIHLRKLGVDLPTWVLSAALEIAYGALKDVMAKES